MILDVIKISAILYTGNKIYNIIEKNDNTKKIEEKKNDVTPYNIDIDTKLKILDSSKISDPLVAPERRLEKDKYGKYPLLINERTRGDPDNYQLVGLLYNKDINKYYQLFGRKTYPGSNEWEYYIRGKDDGGLDIKFPLNTNQEIYDGTTLDIPIDNNIFNVKIYNYDKPRYIPYV
jgi:hypothetical protein